MHRKRKLMLGSALGLVAAIAVAIPAAAALGFFTSVKPYAVPITGDYKIKPLISVGDTVPETSNPAKRFQMIGIPDGLGIRSLGHGKSEVFMNHEVTNTTNTEPVIGDPLNRGSFVSKIRLAKDGSVLSGERAYDTVYEENTLVGPAADTTNSTKAFSRFCSGFLGTSAEGLSEPIYFAGEESGGTGTYYGNGGTAVAIFDNQVHTLPKLGKLPWENLVVLPHTGRKTVILGLEDGPSTPDSQVWMYVGTKVPGASSVLRRNGLDNGRLYVATGTTKSGEADLQTGSETLKWTLIPNAATLDDVQLEAAADAAGAFGFVRVEDGAANPHIPGLFHFVTTGSSWTAPGDSEPANELGRLYRLVVNPFNPTGASKLTVVYNADDVVASGGDTAISPDNMEDNGRYLMLQEDGTSESRVVMGSKGRDGSIWRYDRLTGYTSKRVAELDPPGRDGVAVGPGIWETSGIVDAAGQFGHGSFVFDVQAHSPTARPGANTSEDGQLLLMTRK